MKYAASVGSSASSGTTAIQRSNVMSSLVSERLLSVVDMIVLGGLGSRSVAMKATAP